MEALLYQCEYSKFESACKGTDILSNAYASAPVQGIITQKCSEPTTHVNLMLYVTHENDFMVNRLVSFWTRQKIWTEQGEERFTNFAHAELCFEFDLLGNRFENNTTMGFSINQFTDLYMKTKLWRSEYRSIPIYIPKSKYDALFKLCCYLAQHKIKFDSAGMYASILAPSSFMKTRDKFVHGTFCSRIITEVLQECDIGGEKIQKLEPWRATPNLLSQCLDQDVVGCVPTFVRDTA